MQEAFLRVHAREAHLAGFSGHGIGVAVLDTGIFPHVDLKNRLAVFQNMLDSAGILSMTADMEHMSPGLSAETGDSPAAIIAGLLLAVIWPESKFWITLVMETQMT